MPTRGEVHVRNMKSILESVVRLKDYEVLLEFQIGTYVHQMRNDIVYAAIKNGSDYLMFIDSDIEFPADGILKLLSYDKDVVGGCYNVKILPPKGTVKMLDETGSFIKDYDMPENSLKRVFAIPTGFMLIKLSSIKFMPHPFDFDRYPNGILIGEDVNFCKRLNEQDREVWCDSSIKISHIGDYLY